METNTYMPVAPVGGNFGGDGSYWWIILLFLFAGWGGGGFGGNNGFMGADVQRGFDQSAMMNGINGLQNTVSSGFSQSEIAANSRQMADMNQSFAVQTSILQGFNGLQAQLSQCCCDNRLATVQTQNIVQSEGAATRLAIENQTQAILDKLCALEIDNLKGQIVNLQGQLNAANLSASQTAQTAQIIAALKPAA